MNAKAKAIGNKITDTVSDVLSFPARAYYGSKGRKAMQDATAMRQAHKFKGAPNFGAKGMPTEALKMRTAADTARMSRGQKPIY